MREAPTDPCKALRKIAGAGLAALALVCLTGCSNEYSAKPTYGFIVDAQTRQPVPGVVVLAHWDLEYGLEGGSAYAWVLKEAVTDAQGRFDIPGWGPSKVPEFLPSGARLKDRDPRVVFFKLGYEGIAQTVAQAGKEYDRPRDFPTRGAAVREWYLNGETFQYRPAGGDARRIAQGAQAFNLELSYLRGGPCPFAEIPRSFLALKAAYEQVVTTEEGKAVFRYGRPAHERWLASSPQVEASQREHCGTTAREALERAQRK
jgi:hypothetical protein